MSWGKANAQGGGEPSGLAMPVVNVTGDNPTRLSIRWKCGSCRCDPNAPLQKPR